MDVAAFVGFAAAGPLHVPVEVDSPDGFRDVFGSDVTLGWETARGEFRRSHLGGTVEAFFANGGRRCWVVRVAGSGAVRATFPLEGLVDAEHRHALDGPVVARARAAGSWFDDLAVGTVLERESMPLIGMTEGAEAGVRTPNGYRLDLAADPASVQPHDLLEVTFGAGAPVLLLFAERAVPIAGGVRVESAPPPASGETPGAFWLIPPVASTPPAAASGTETEAPEPLTEAAGIAEAEAVLVGSPPAVPAVRRLSFALRVWRGTELVGHLGGLAFHADHARFWGKLPTDEELFRPEPGSGTPREPDGLVRDAAAPRFPLAGPETAATHYLPWGMGRRRDRQAAGGLPAVEGEALVRDGLARFDAGLFVDRRLAVLGSGALLAEAEHRLHVAGQALTGMHALLPVRQASLVAVPDSVHRGWSRELPEERRPPPGAPTLQQILAPDPAGRHNLNWSAVAEAEGYQLQYDADPAFPTPVPAFEGEKVSAAVVLPTGCPRDVFFRVRAFRGGEIGPWSNTRNVRVPAADFSACEAGRPDAVTLGVAEEHASPPGPALVWDLDEAGGDAPDSWEIETALDPGFSAASAYTPGDVDPGVAPLPVRRFAARYYRVRAARRGVHGPWSNTVRVTATERAAFTETAEADHDPTVLLSVHRALLRFAAARGDFLALLALPNHFGVPEAVEHTGRLTPGGPEAEPEAAPAEGLPPRVRPLTEGEAPVLSFGALYHPWIVARADSETGSLRRLPPDGAIAGVCAALALGPGAWRAPANRPLAGVVALEPALGADAWARLVGRRINAVVRDPRGFLARSADTLGGERALGRVHVRRLMILLRRAALREGQRWVFEPLGPYLRRRVRHRFQAMLASLFQRGAFSGASADEAFRVVANGAAGARADDERSRLIVELRVAPAAALTFLTVRLLTAGTGRIIVEEA
jgi:hypothetical protein